MQSKNKVDLSEFMEAMVTTPDDVAALDHVREANQIDRFEYLQFLEQFSAKHPAGREIPERHEPFAL
jgi:hypothetical protein